MEVFPGKSPAETKKALEAKEAVKSSGMLFDRLFVRHWDTWKDGTRNHVFVLPLGADGKPAGPAKDLMPQMDADAPTKPFGGLDEIAVTRRRQEARLHLQGRRPRGGLVDELRPLGGPDGRLGRPEADHDEPRLGRHARASPPTARPSPTSR